MLRIANSIYGKECLRAFFILTIAFVVGPTVSSQNQGLRTYTPEDLLRLEEIGETALSPDGELLAYVVKRAKSAGPVDFVSDLNNNEHADVWIVSVKTQTTANVTNGLVIRAGYFAPRWSPDGERLAMLSVRDRSVRLAVWTRSAQKLEVISEDVVAPIAVENFQEPYCWRSNRQLIYVTANHRAKLAHEILAGAATKINGSASTASVLDSGVPGDINKRPQEELKLINVVSKEQQTIASAPGFGEILLSPDTNHVAFLQQISVWRPDAVVDQITRLNPAIYQLSIADLTKSSPTRTFAGATEALPGSLLWSPDSNELAMIGYSDGSTTQIIFRCDVVSARCMAVSNQFPDLDPYKLNRYVRPPVTWIGTGELLLNSLQDSQHGQAPRNRSPEWWAIDQRGNHRRLIPKGSTAPKQILSQVGTSHLIALINKQLFEIDDRGQILKPIDATVDDITDIVWTDSQNNVSNVRTRGLSAAMSVDRTLIAETRDASTSKLWKIDIKSGRAKLILKPAPNAKVLASNSVGTIALFADDNTGTYIWTASDATKSLNPTVAINSFLKGISLPQQMKFEYRSSDGAPLNGWAMLPTDYQNGKKYPLIVFVYPGKVFGNTPPYSYHLNFILQLNPFDLRLLASRGYLILFPSMPLKPYGSPEDPYMELTKGVLPAIDKLVQIGIADPDRVGLMGYSYGGYAVYGLITQTKRFRAAVAGGGFTNLTSSFGTFHTEQRYESNGHENLMRMWNVESIAMGGPPWKDLGRYLRNSPITYVDRVETPLLILHGDLDGAVQIEQAEEFFTSLYRQNKRARLVRYFGEGHPLSNSAANVRNVWDQIFSWFEEFLKPLSQTSTAKPK
jgi:dipeptidyl aminopeptidase/acylaminoacyl peptidase